MQFLSNRHRQTLDDVVNRALLDEDLAPEDDAGLRKVASVLVDHLSADISTRMIDKVYLSGRKSLNHSPSADKIVASMMAACQKLPPGRSGLYQ